MAEKTNNGLSEIDVTCSICLDRLHRPHEIDPCKHMFCQPCLIRLSQAGGTNCPLCRGVINTTKFNRALEEAIQNQYPEDYLSRENLEVKSGIFVIPVIPGLAGLHWRYFWPWNPYPFQPSQRYLQFLERYKSLRFPPT